MTTDHPAGRSASDRSVDAFHRGAFRIVQPRKGSHRAGIDALLLAAAVPSAFAGCVADLGSGSGTAAMAVLSRCPQAGAVLVEREPVMCALARESLDLPGNEALAERASVIEADVELRGPARRAAGLADASFDFAIMNPPFNAPDDRATPEPLRQAAHVMHDGLLEGWIRTASAILKPKGGLAVIARPQSLGALLAALSGRFGAVELLPVAPRPGAAAIRVVLRGRKGSRKPLELLPALVLHDTSGNAFSAAAEALINGRSSLFGD